MAARVPKIILDDFNNLPDSPNTFQNGITEMDFDRMEVFPNHKFKAYEGRRLSDMVESIRLFGILLPIILWRSEDGKYIILSGHNRVNAAKLAAHMNMIYQMAEEIVLNELVLKIR